MNSDDLEWRRWVRHVTIGGHDFLLEKRHPFDYSVRMLNRDAPVVEPQ